jgi:hypothetical protein
MHLQDLFAATYSSFPAPVPAWQTGPPHGMGFNMQYNATMVKLNHRLTKSLMQ